MNQPYDLTKAFKEIDPNFELLDKLYKREQREYIRRRLKAIRLLWEGKERIQVENICGVSRRSLLEWIRIIVTKGTIEGLKQLAQARKSPKSGKLNASQQTELLRILEEEQPRHYGYAQNIFTAKMLVEIVKDKWQIDVSDQTIYNILQRQGFSHQRAHRDYGTPDVENQAAFQDVLKKTEYEGSD